MDELIPLCFTGESGRKYSRQGKAGVPISRKLWIWISGGASLVLALTLYTKWYIEHVSPVKVSQTLAGVAYMEEAPDYEQPVRLTFDGYYFKRGDYFKGTVRINEREYANCMMYNGTSVIQYVGAERIVQADGKVYMDKELKRIFWAARQADLPPELGNGLSTDAQVLLAAPALNRTEAAHLRMDLEQAHIDEIAMK
ncbi:hypothetical protein [Paenibacillus macerans]|uniref:hypothetical protein n=1 Tax=Paenibacillus macerans TaxID=44252 RepID=UPI003D31A1E3